ncbi:sulfite exporter TauE/SafE family protein [Herbaspirillum sp. RV1423]|uniref:sulfite exporter TauE/SafE family protein n=1 Tax=Herbaspirillum sp. RV1423 TaxID=1443993 RepID=UPI0004B4E852|nr:sulfite exporter TauE/SafE family protein [Herbaspirillum sp. RV1423]
MQTNLSFDTAHVLLLSAVTGIFLLAGFVKGVVGLGLPTVAVGLLGLFMPPQQAAALLIVPSLATNLWQLLAGGRFVWLLRRLWLMLAGIVAGTLLGANFMAADSVGHATIALGMALIAYALLGLAAARFSVSAGKEKYLSPVIGLTTGLITAATAVFVIPAVPYLQALNLEKDELIQALGLSFTVSTIAMAAGLAQGGALHMEGAAISLIALLPALGGMFVGQWLRAKISAVLFRRCFFVGLLLLGLHLSSHLWR